MYKIKLLGILLCCGCLNMAQAATYYVSNVGNDSNDGLSVNTSWASLAKVNSTTFQAGDSVLFRRGDTWRGHVEISDSGKAGAPLVFDAFGESNLPRPTINGSELLTGWQRCSATTCGNLPNVQNIFFTKVNLPQLLYKKNPADKGTYYNQGVSQLFVNGTPALYARHPNSGYLFNEQAVDSNTLKIKQTDWDTLPTKNLIGAYAHTKSARWTLGTQTISAVNYTNRTIDLFGSPLIASGWGYFLNNKLEMLDSAGEWFFDDKKLTVYFWPPAGVDLNTAVVEGSGYALDVPSTDGTSTLKDIALNGFNVLNTDSNIAVSYVTVRNFHIIQHSGTGVNALADNLLIDNNFIEYVDGPGIFVSRNVMGQNAISIRNNRINYSNNIGIHLKAEDSEVVNNTITNIGRFESLGKLGMSGTPPKNNQYVGNPNDDGVGVRFYGQNLSLKGNHLNYIGHNGFFFKAKNFRLEENIINHPCYTKADCGGIYTYFANIYLPENANLNIVLRRNIVLNSIGNTDGARRYAATDTGIHYEIPFGMGVYIDGHGKGITLEENAAVNSSASGLIIQDSSDITLIGNVAINNKSVQLDIPLQEAPYMENFNLKQNMLYSLDKTQKTVSIPSLTNSNGKNSSNLLKSSDENYLFNPYSHNTPSSFLDPAYYVIIRGGTGTNNYSLATWQKELGLDLHSASNWFYLKPYTIAKTLGDNLLKNPDFSTGISSWNNNFGVTAWDAKVSGGSMAVDRGTQTFGTTATYGEILNLVPGKQYRIQFTAATRDKIAPVAVSIQRTGSGTTTERTILRSAFTLSTQPQEFYEVFTVPDTTPVQLIFSTTKDEIDHYWLDNISLQEVIAYDLPVSDAHVVDINGSLPFNFRTALFPKKAIFFYNSANTAKDFDLQNVSYRTLNNLPFGQDSKFAKYYANGKLHLEAAGSVILIVDSFAPLATTKLNLNSGVTNGQLVGGTLFSLKTDGTLSYSVNNTPQTLALQNTGFGLPVGGFKGEVTGVLYLTQGHVRYPMGSLLVTTSLGKLYHWHPYLQAWQSSDTTPLKGLFSIPSAEGELLAVLDNNNVVLLDSGAKIPLSSIGYPSQETVKYITRDDAGVFYYVVTATNQVHVFNALASVWSKQ